MGQATAPKYIGYRDADWETTYSGYFSPEISPKQAHIAQALLTSPGPASAFIALEDAPTLQQAGYFPIETGYSLQPDGSARVAVLTHMPGVKPQMWDWWFAWHGSHANRYKLWHPLAHLDARWQDGLGDTGQYIGRTSLIEEFIGSKLEKAAIRFIAPQELGFTAVAEKDEVVYICARVGFSDFPLDFGWLVHQLRTVDGGTEMRSRFWMGGKHIQLRMPGRLPELLSRLVQKFKRPSAQQAKELMLHCAEEMNHLAIRLPGLYADYHK